jgi:hypothetical protein
MSPSAKMKSVLPRIRSILALFLGLILIACLAGANAPGTSAARGEPLDLHHTISLTGTDNEADKVERPAESAALYLPAAFSSFPDKSYPIYMGDLVFESVKISSLVAGTTQRWTMVLTTGESITVNAAPGNTADIVLSISDDEGNLLIDQQNNSPPGEVESVEDLIINEAGTYNLYVRAANDMPADYALLLLDEDSYELLFRGRLAPDEPVDEVLPADTDHVWLISGQSGEYLTISVVPSADGDAYVEFYGPDGEILAIADDNGPGEPEKIENYPVQQSGLYAVRIGEFYFNPLTYQITLVRSKAAQVPLPQASE